MMAKLITTKLRHISFTVLGGPHQTSDEDRKREDLEQTSDAEQVTQDKRHYCRNCFRKRVESVMEKFGTGAYGKQRWICIDRFACTMIRKKKIKLKLIKP